MGELIQIPAKILAASDRSLAGRADLPVRTDAVYVVFTSIEDTLAAVKVAHSLATTMSASLKIAHLWMVPTPLPVDAPTGISPAESEAFLARLRAEGVSAEVCICLCRSDQRAIAQAFKPRSLVVLAGRRHWWPTPLERRLRALEAAGHHVLCVSTCKTRKGNRGEVDDGSRRRAREEPASPATYHLYPGPGRANVSIEKGATRA
ncbi:MAG: hypothetical protein DMF89_00995 [Acidobacteria bacterium]|nr:MAG: hypothetical protein DMF89_00995 [Acidobacteriota bacterium]